ncbi:MAG: site-specific integrase [Rhizomicrobium sp.]
MHLTDLTLKRLRVPEKGRVTYSDDSVPGFGVRVSAGGAKSFVLLLGRSRKRVTIGRYPTITLSDARSHARELIAARVLGKDDLPSMKFEDAIPIFLAAHFGDNYPKPRTRSEIERLLRRHFLPKFRFEQLAHIKAHEIGSDIDSLRKTPSIAHHAFAAIRMFFRWAEGRRYVQRSPCVGLRPPRTLPARERVLTRDELRAVFSHAMSTPSTFSRIVQLLILTGQRRSEIASIEQSWIDWDNRTITFPPSITKNKRQHVLPFGPAAAAVLRQGEKKGCLFPARGQETAFDGWSKCKPKFDEALSLPHWTLHDLRRTFATNVAALGTPVHVTEKVLNHISGSTGGIVAVYQRHSYQKEMREAIEQWEAYLALLMLDDGLHALVGGFLNGELRRAA